MSKDLSFENESGRALALAESALREQSTLLQSVFDAMAEGVIVARRGTSEPTLNPAARRILAIKDSTTWSDWLRDVSVWSEGRSEQIASGETPFARLADGTTSGEIEISLRQPSIGVLVAVAASVTRLTDEAGLPVGGVMVLRDITERKMAEKTRAMLAGLIDATRYAGGGSWTMRTDQIVQTWNPGAEKLYGYSAVEMVARSIRTLDPPGRDPEACNLLISRLATGGGTEEFETTFRRKDGTVIDVAVAWAPMRGLRGEVVAISCVSYDITDRKHAEQKLLARTEELTRSNAELEQFAYVASHDLQEPLRMVASYLQLIEQRYKGKLDADADDFIRFAVDGAVRMKQLINDLLLFSRAGRNGISASVNLTKVVEHSLAVLKLAIDDAHAIVTYDPMPSVTGSESRLGEVIQNLVGNALKFRDGRPPEVHIGCERQGKNWMFSVRDNGIGMAPEFHDRIFVMFQRLHGREEYSGTGIGLAICKRVIEHHGGRIWVESKPEQGSTFFFTLPAASEVRADGSSD
jgi:PAS domain S-box-containing protein